MPSPHEGRANPVPKPTISVEGLLGWRNTIRKRIHPDLLRKLTDSGDKKLVEDTVRLINVAYDCVERGTGWSTPYKENDVISVGGLNSKDEFIKSGYSTLSTPVAFLNKVCKFLGLINVPANKPEAGPTAEKPESQSNPSTAQTPEHERDFLSFGVVASAVKKLAKCNVSVKLSSFDQNPHINSVLAIYETIQLLANKIQLDFLNTTLPNQVVVEFKPMPSPHIDEVLIHGLKSEKVYKITTDGKYWENIGLLIKHINSRPTKYRV